MAGRPSGDLETFVAGAAHDLREPLQTALGHIDLLEARTPAGDALGRENIEAARQSLLRMRASLDDMLAFVRTDQAAPLEPVEVAGLARAVVADLAALLEREGAAVDVGDLPVVQGHPPHVSRILQNLVANGVKYHGERPPVVRISAHRSGPQWVIDVTDNGRGLQPEELSRLFRPFSRLSSSKGVPGTGLGLAMSARLAGAMGGRLWAESEAGIGTTFHLALGAA